MRSKPIPSETPVFSADNAPPLCDGWRSLAYPGHVVSYASDHRVEAEYLSVLSPARGVIYTKSLAWDEVNGWHIFFWTFYPTPEKHLISWNWKSPTEAMQDHLLFDGDQS